MNKILLATTFLLTISFASLAQVDGDYRSAGTGGDWSNAATWEILSGGVWVAATVAPNESDGVITILNNDVVLVSTAISADQVVVAGGGTLTIENGGTLSILNSGTGTDLEVFVDPFLLFPNGVLNLNAGGTLENFSSISSISSNAIVSGTYIHNQDGGTVLNGTWNSGSSLVVRNVTNTMPSGINQTYFDFEWDCPGQIVPLFLNTLSTVTNDFILTESGGLPLVLSSGSGSLSIGRDLQILNSGYLYLTPTGVFTVDVGRDLFLNSTANQALVLTINGTGTINIAGDFTNDSGVSTSLNLVGGTGTGLLNLEGDFNHLTGNISSTGSGNATFVFTGTTLQNVNITGSINDAIDYAIQSGAVIELGTSQFTGGGDFLLESGGVLRVGSVAPGGAIQNNTSAGNILVPVANRTYETGSRIVYSGASAQFIGNGHPANPEFELDNAAGASLASSVSINGLLTLTNGNLSILGNTLTLGGSLVATSNFINTTSSSNLIVNGSGAFGVFPLQSGGQSIGNITINRPSGSVIVQEMLSVSGAMTLTAGSFIFSDLTLNGTYSSGGGSLSSAANGVLEIAGTGAFGTLNFAGGGNTLDSLIINRNGSTVSLNSTAIINEALLVSNGTFDNSGGLLTMAPNSTLVKDGAAMFSGISPTINSGTYNLTYTGVSQSTESEMPPVSEPTDLGTLTIDAQTVTLTQNIFVNGGLNLDNGALEAGTFNVNMRNGDWVKTGGTFTPGSGTVVFSGTSSIIGTTPRFGNLTMTTTGNLTFPPNNIRVSGTLQLASSGTFSANGSILVLDGSGAQLVSAGGKRLNNIDLQNGSRTITLQTSVNVEGLIDFNDNSITLASSGNLLLLSETDGPDGTGANGRVGVITSGSSVTGNVTVQRYMSQETLGSAAGLYRYITPSVQGLTVAGWQDDFAITGTFTGASTGPGLLNNPSMFYYDETVTGDLQQGYFPYPAPAGSSADLLTIGRGYAAWVIGDSQKTIDAIGPINQGNLSIPVTYTNTGDAAADGWNLVGNPYPSSISWDNEAGWNKANVTNTIAVRDNGGGGIFRYWNGTDAGGGMRVALLDGEIAKGQAFWVNATASGNLDLNENAKIPASSEFYREGSFTPNQLIIALDKGDQFDEALVVFTEEATEGYDRDVDISKFDNGYFDLSTFNADGAKLAFNYKPLGGCSMEFGIDISDATSGEYTISFRSLETFETPYDIMLIDSYTSETINVRESPAYSFDINANDDASFGSGRFKVVLTTDIDQLVAVGTTINSPDNVCQGESAQISIPSTQSGVAYQLLVNDELFGEPVRGDGEISFEVPNEVLNEGGNLVRVQASIESCGSTIELDTELEIVKSTLTPEITVSGNTLNSNYEEGNQWYFNGEPIEGATSSELVASESGLYTLEVTFLGCLAQASTEYVVTDIEDDLFGAQINLYPVPAMNDITVTINLQTATQETTIAIYNMLGELMISRQVSNGEYTFDIANWKSGIYLLKVNSQDEVQVKRFVKE